MLRRVQIDGTLALILGSRLESQGHWSRTYYILREHPSNMQETLYLRTMENIFVTPFNTDFINGILTTLSYENG